MRRQRQFLLQTGGVPTILLHQSHIRAAYSEWPVLLSATFCVGSAHKEREGWRENSSTATLGAHPAPEWRDLPQGFDTLF